MFWINTVLALKASAINSTYTDPLKRLSAVGPSMFCEEILTPRIFDVLRPGLSEPLVWRAVDNASTLIAIGKQFPLKPELVARGANDLLKEKIAKWKKNQKDKKEEITSPAFLEYTIDELSQQLDAENRILAGFPNMEILTGVEFNTLWSNRNYLNWRRAFLEAYHRSDPGGGLPREENIVRDYFYPRMETRYRQLQEDRNAARIVLNGPRTTAQMILPRQDDEINWNEIANQAQPEGES
jgi:hypothetical protein